MATDLSIIYCLTTNTHIWQSKFTRPLCTVIMFFIISRKKTPVFTETPCVKFEDLLWLWTRPLSTRLTTDYFLRRTSTLIPEQFKKNSPSTAWFREKCLVDLIRQLQKNRNWFMQCCEISITSDLSDWYYRVKSLTNNLREFR